MFRGALRSMIGTTVLGLLLGAGVGGCVDADDSRPLDGEDLVTYGLGLVIVLVLVVSMIVQVVLPRFARRRQTPEEREAERRVDAAMARINAEPEVYVPRAPGPEDAEAELDRPLPSPPRIDDDPFRSPPQRHVVVTRAEPLVVTPPPPVVPGDNEDPKRLR